jgi:hypothetical protein
VPAGLPAEYYIDAGQNQFQLGVGELTDSFREQVSVERDYL